MRIAALSDIHGNLSALDAVLADIKNRQVDQIVNLGDILSGGLYRCRRSVAIMNARCSPTALQT